MAEEIRAKVVIDNKDAKKNIQDVKKGTKELNNELNGTIGNFQIMGVSLNGIKSSFSKIIPAAKSMFSTVKAGIASTGIGLLVIAVGSLISYFTNTKKGAEQLQVAFKAVGAAISVITDRISKIGGAIVKVFKGDFKGAAEDAKSAVSGLGKEIVEETKQMIELTKTLQKVRDAERDFSKERAQTNKVIAEARLLAEDENASYEERLEALKKANELEISTTEKAIALQKEKLEAKKAEVEASESMAEDLDEIAALEVQLIDMQTASFMKRKRLMTAEETLRKEQQAAANTAAREEAALQEELAKKEEERLKKEEEDRLALEEKKKTEADQLRERQEELALLQLENAQERALQELEFQMQAELRAVEGAENAEQQKYLIKQKYTKLRNDLTVSEQQFTMASANASLNVIKGYLSAASENHVEGTKKWKKLKVAEATISGLQSAVNAFKSTSEIPVVGAVLAPIAAAAALMATNQQIAKIKATEIPEQKLAKGGIVGGYGTGTSDTMRTRLSKGETVINAKSSKMFLPLLSAMNAAGGGDDFAGAGNSAQQADNGGSVIKAYVLTDEMSNDQDRLSKIRRRSSLS